MRVVLAPAASTDIEQILAWSHERFGEQARRRYESLLACAIQDVGGDPERVGSRDRPELTPGARTYHIRQSRSRLQEVVTNPRHFLVYRCRRDDVVEIARVLHDSMDLARHLPADPTM